MMFDVLSCFLYVVILGQGSKVEQFKLMIGYTLYKYIWKKNSSWILFILISPKAREHQHGAGNRLMNIPNVRRLNICLTENVQVFSLQASFADFANVFQVIFRVWI